MNVIVVGGHDRKSVALNEKIEHLFGAKVTGTIQGRGLTPPFSFAGADGVVILTNLCGRNSWRQVAEEAKKQGIPFALATSNMPGLKTALERLSEETGIALPAHRGSNGSAAADTIQHDHDEPEGRVPLETCEDDLEAYEELLAEASAKLAKMTKQRDDLRIRVSELEHRVEQAESAEDRARRAAVKAQDAVRELTATARQTNTEKDEQIERLTHTVETERADRDRQAETIGELRQQIHDLERQVSLKQLEDDRGGYDEGVAAGIRLAYMAKESRAIQALIRHFNETHKEGSGE